MTKPGKKLFIIGLLIILAVVVYFFIIRQNGSPFGFGFGFGSQTSKYAIPIIFKSGTIADNDCIGQIPGQPGKLVTGSSSSSTTPVIWASTVNTAQQLAAIPAVSTPSTLQLINTSKFTSTSPNILWLFPTKMSTGKSTSGTQMFDTFIWPANISLTSDQMITFNWYMNQDSINTYMSDIDLDIDYDNVTGGTDDETLNPPKPTNSMLPPNWGKGSGSSDRQPFIKQTIGKALYGISHFTTATDSQTAIGGGAGTSTSPNGDQSTYTSNQISRTNNFVTVIADYTNLYSYICGYSNLSDSTQPGYGLANIKVGTTSTSITESYYSKTKIGSETTVGNWMGKPGAFNDSAFYKDGSNSENKQSDFVLDGNVKHAIWSVLLARQNQLIGRLEPKIVATL